MSSLIPILIIVVGASFILFVPLGRWKNLEKTFLLETPPADNVVIKRFTDVLLDGVQLNGLVSVFIYKDCLVLRHISPLMKPLIFRRCSMSKANTRKVGFDIFEVSEGQNGKKITIGFRTGVLSDRL